MACLVFSERLEFLGQGDPASPQQLCQALQSKVLLAARLEHAWRAQAGRLPVAARARNPSSDSLGDARLQLGCSCTTCCPRTGPVRGWDLRWQASDVVCAGRGGPPGSAAGPVRPRGGARTCSAAAAGPVCRRVWGRLAPSGAGLHRPGAPVQPLHPGYPSLPACALAAAWQEAQPVQASGQQPQR